VAEEIRTTKKLSDESKAILDQAIKTVRSTFSG
jgi:hypothetical protein